MNMDHLMEMLEGVSGAMYEQGHYTNASDFDIKPNSDGTVELICTIPLTERQIRDMWLQLGVTRKVLDNPESGRINISFTATQQPPEAFIPCEPTMADINLYYSGDQDILYVDFFPEQQEIYTVVYDHEPIIMFVDDNGAVKRIGIRYARKFIKKERQKQRD